MEFCKAWAAAIFGDATKVEYRSLTAKERFTALQTGEVDVLSRNSTWTLTRDVDLALTFGPTTFYDGQAMMVRKDLPATEETTLKDLEGANICVQTGTTTELNLADQMKAGQALFAAIMAGAAGYVLKEIRSSDLVSAIRTVAGGQSLIDPAMTETARLADWVLGGTWTDTVRDLQGSPWRAALG